MAKRRGDHAEAAQLWRTLLTGSQHAIEAVRATGAPFRAERKDFAQAVEYAELGLTKLYAGGQRLRDPYA